MRCGFPKICTRAPFGQIAYLKQIFEYFPGNNSVSDDQSSRQRQHRHSAAAQHNTHAVIATLNPASHLVYPQPESINLPVQHHQQRLQWSEASRYRGAACLYELLLGKEPLRITRIAHTQHTTYHKTKTTQHDTQATSTPTATPTTAQLVGGKRPRYSSYPGVLCGQRAGALTSFAARSRSCTLVLRL